MNHLYNKLDEVKETLAELQFDVFGVSETWLTPDITDNEIKIPGYTAIRRDRQDRNKKQGGGLVVYVRTELNAKKRTDLMENKDTECIWIEINRPKSKPLVIGSIYRPPDATLDTYLSDIEDQLHKLDHTKTEIAIMGDFNVDMLSKSRPKTKRQSVRNFLLANDLEQVIELPTRVCESSKTLIDLFCVNNEHRVMQTEVISSSISDHSIIMCVFKSGVPKLPSRTYKSRTLRTT